MDLTPCVNNWHSVRAPVSYTHLDVYKRQVQNRRILIDKTPKRTGEELVPITPFLFLLFMGTRLPWLSDYGPVSYSHLDVYKRQLLVWVIFRSSQRFDLLKKHLHISVSYTHLDVYKRQVVKNGKSPKLIDENVK